MWSSVWAEGRKRFFFEKKNQKTFIYAGAVLGGPQQPGVNKNFCGALRPDDGAGKPRRLNRAAKNG
jgi:hypothetical protein